MIKKGYFKGRVLTMMLATSMIVGMVPETAMIANAESLENTQIEEQVTDEGATNYESSESDIEEEKEYDTENEPENESENKTDDNGEKEVEDNSEGENGSEGENSLENEDEPEENNEEEAETDDETNGETEDEVETGNDADTIVAPWEDTSELTEEELKFYESIILTDEEKAAIENGEITLKELIQQLMNEKEAISEVDIIEEENVNTADSQFTWNNNIIVKYNGTDAEVEIPARAIAIEANAFNGNTTITKIDMSNSGVRYIGENAFKNCSSLQEVSLPSGIYKIKEYAFYNCSSLNEINLPNSISSIETSAFDKCTNLNDVTLPQSLASIGMHAFATSGIAGADATGKLVIPASVTAIGWEAFLNCDSITEVEFQGYQLNSCSSEVFKNCDSLKTASFVNTKLVKIPAYVLHGCTAVESVSWPGSVNTIGEYAFYNCSSLNRVDLNNGIKSIETSAFDKCTNLNDVTLPQSLASIGMHAFATSGIAGTDATGKLVIPASVTTIGWEAFLNCHSLTEVEFQGSNLTSFNTDVFKNCSSLTKLYVLAGTSTDKALRNRGYGNLIQGYKGAEYSIEYVLNGGTNNSGNPTKYYWASSVALKNPVRTGYTFQGWYTGSDYKTKVTSIAQGSTGNRTLYAKWVANKYTVKFSGNGGKGTTKTMTCSYDQSYKLNTNKYSKKGYSFAGWTLSKNGSGKVYTNCEQIKNLTAQNNGTVTLYAKWAVINYSINYVVYGGNKGSNPTSYTVTNNVKFKNAYKQGYTFKGWYKDAKRKKKISKISKNSTGNMTLYAKFAGNKYSVAFNANGGSGRMATVSGTYSDGKKLPACNMTKTDMVFAGWNTKPDGTGTHYDNGASLASFATSAKKAKKITLYAEWVAAPEE